MGITNGFLHGDLARQIPKYPEGYAGKERYYTKVLNEPHILLLQRYK